MDIDQQFRNLSKELQNVQEENKCLMRKYTTLIEENRNLQKLYEGRKGDAEAKTELELKPMELENLELHRLVKKLESKVSLLEIQLSTYMEDFQMERKDREAAQDRVIKLEQELANLCSGKCSDYRQVCTDVSTADSFEIWPSPTEFCYPAETIPPPPTSKKPGPLREPTKPSSSRKPGNIINLFNFSKKKIQNPTTSVEKESISGARGLGPSPQYEFDGPPPGNRYKVKGFYEESRSVSRSNEKVIKVISPENSRREVSSTRNVSSVTLTPLVKALSSSCSPTTVSSNLDESKKRLTTSSSTCYKEKKRGFDSDEILRCPACFKAFEASSEHYKLLQHMDKCGQ